MALSLEKFVRQLEDSGILADETIHEFIPPKATPKDAIELARDLVRKKKLTKFQVEEISRGKGQALVLGNYVLLEQIGAGGMGQVFKARHRRMDRLVAVKLLPPAMTKNQAAIARFEREVKAAAKITHPNIVAAHDADCANGVYFLVMELVEGSDLSALVKQDGPFPVEKAVNYILQGARGLEAAHKKGIVHRDIKPANLLLDHEGTVKILDMGLARLSLDGDDGPQPDLTSTGTIMGTVDYMAPEQALDTKTADARADIYALGCSLYFLLAGRSTYDGDTIMKKLLAHREHPIPDLRAACLAVNEQLDAVFKKMVAKKVEDRFQSMSDVIAELDRCSSTSVTTVSIPQAATQPGPHPATQAFAGGSFDFLKNEPEHAPTIRASVPKNVAAGNNAGRNRQLTLIGAALLSVVILAGIIISLSSRDGTLVVEIDQPDATVRVLDAEGKVEITRPGGQGKITISVDPGKHRLQVEKDGFAVFGQDIEIAAGGKKPIKAKLVPLGEKPIDVKSASANQWDTPEFDQWMKDVAAMPALQQIEVARQKLKELNPEFNGDIKQAIRDDKVTAITISTLKVHDISPLRVFNNLETLNCSGEPNQTGMLTDLSPLQGMRLKSLELQGNSHLTDLSPLRGMPLTALGLYTCYEISDLEPLRGMQLTSLNVGGSRVSDLRVLRGMPLKELNLYYIPASDIGPLKGMPLEYLYMFAMVNMHDISPIADCSRLTELAIGGAMTIDDLSPLKRLPLKKLMLNSPEKHTELLQSIKTLAIVNDKPIDEFWKSIAEGPQRPKLGYELPGFDLWVKEVQAMPADKQIEAVAKKLVELNPGFDGKVSNGGDKNLPMTEQGVVRSLVFVTDNVTDISPVRSLAGLRILMCNGSRNKAGQLSDLSPLKGMQLDNIGCYFNTVSDLSPLRGMQLKGLSIFFTKVSDLSPLEGMPLEYFDGSGLTVTNFESLKSCGNLKTLILADMEIKAAIIAELQTALPNCKVKWDDPSQPKSPK